MAYTIDTRSVGGDLVVIGKTLVLPHSSDTVEVGSEPMVASLRYNPAADRLEAYLPTGSGGWTWETVAANRYGNSVVTTAGAQMRGDIVMSSGTIYADSGIPATPSISFDAKRTTGLSVDQNGFLRLSSNAKLIATASDTRFTVHGELTADTLTLDRVEAMYGIYDAMSANTVQVHRGLVTDRMEANTANVIAMTTHDLSITPAVDNDPGLVTEITMTTNGLEWAITHNPEHDLAFTFAGREILALTRDGKMRFEEEYEIDQIFRSDAAYPVGTVVVVGGTQEITTTTTVGSTKVAGVVEFTDPSNRLVLANGKRIGCQVTGTIAKGDHLVTSNIAGRAMAANGAVAVGALVGIALEPSTGAAGFIEVKLP